MLSFAPAGTERPSSRCCSSVRLLKLGIKLAFSRLEVTPTGPQLPATAASAITAASATATRTGTTHPGLRGTGTPAKSRASSNRHDTARQTTIQTMQTASPIRSGP